MNDIYRTVCRGCHGILQKYSDGWHHIQFFGTGKYHKSWKLNLPMDRVCIPDPVELKPVKSEY